MIWRSAGTRLVLVALIASLTLWTLFRLVVQPPPSDTTASDKLNHVFSLGRVSEGSTSTAAGGQQALTTQSNNKILVTGKLSHEDTSWIEKELPDWQQAIYVTDDQSAPLHTRTNRSHEATAYLTYIVDNYDNLPSFMAFIRPHAIPHSPHEREMDRSNPYMLRHLQVWWVEGVGYANFRCVPAGNCLSDPEASRILVDQPQVPRHVYRDVWRGFFGDSVKFPDEIASNGGGQFGVSSFQVRRKRKDEYQKMLDYLHEAPFSDEDLNRVTHDLWHVIFGQEPVNCLSRRQCYNLVYGRIGII